MHRIAATIMVAALAAGAPAQTPPPRAGDTTGDRVQDVVTQPARDVGIQRTTIPAVLELASEDPYSMTGARTCTQIAASVIALNDVLGADFDTPEEDGGNQAGRVAEAGGRAIVESLIPFRGVVREISGAASADRRLQAATYAGLARRGFLRGLHQARGCRTSLTAPAARERTESDARR